MTPYQELAEQLKADILTLDKLRANVVESAEICRALNFDTLTPQDNREIEALTARFERAQDFFVTKVLRIIDVFEGEEGTTLDVLNRAEKRTLIESAAIFREMRVLRNKIAHEYAGYGPADVARAVLDFVPVLLDAFERAREYATRPEFRAS